ncbi:MAG: SDR family oxidoreductase [Thermoanaerobaculia bacterium]
MSLATGEVLDDEILPHQLLVGNHRDHHPADIQARRFMSRLMKATDDAELVRRRMKKVRELGHQTSEVIAKIVGQKDPEKISKALFGLKRKEYFFRYKKPPRSKQEIDERLEDLRRTAAAQQAAAEGSGKPWIRVLLTGGTGFIGQEILWQAAHDPDVAEVVALVRPQQIRDRKTGEVTRVLTPAERGETLLRRLWLDRPDERTRFHFIAGDVEQPDVGIAAKDLEDLGGRLTHVIHCAASVAFDDPYEKSFGANVTGNLNALRVSHALQSAPGSPFVAHLAVETSYIHGRQVNKPAREDEIVFPRNFYNNYYELTKAMASIETERFMLAKGLRVVQLCPAIVIGEYRTGNNRGDTKVVNAPVNVFGRAHQALSRRDGRWIERSTGALLARLACVFPGDPSAEINLVPVDRVAAGIVAAAKRPQAVGRRIHLATDNRVTSEKIRQMVAEELGVRIQLADPTLHRTMTLPVLTKVLRGLKQERLATALNKLGTIFGGYSEWGQPVHEVANDVEILGLPAQRPDSERAFRMLCRHNRWVQEFGKVRDGDEISRREKVWAELIRDLEARAGCHAGAIPAEDFQRALHEELDLESFERR